MKVAVTGATGFIGRHVVMELLRRDVEVVAVLRPGSILPPALSALRPVYIDITRPPPDALACIGCPDVVVHLAWGGLPNYRSLHHFEIELPSHYMFLKSLVQAGIKRLLAVGTCFEYGMQSGLLHEDLAVSPANPYGFAKDALRRQLEYLKDAANFELTWARLFYLYGEGQSPNSLYPLLRRAAMAGEATFPMSGGEQLRDFLPITSAARHLVDLATSSRSAGVVNVCSGRPVSVRALVERWIEENHWSIAPALGCHPYSHNEPLAFWGSTRKLREHSNVL